MKWKGPYKISAVLENCLNGNLPKIPAADSVYLISRKDWKKKPTKECDPLYVGSNTGKSPRFRTRVGDLIADMFGFYGDKNEDKVDKSTGHHSGGQSLHDWCKKREIESHESIHQLDR